MISKLLELEAVLLLLALLGVFLRRCGLINDSGRSFLTDLVTDVILPCNIFLSFLSTSCGETLRSSLPTVSSEERSVSPQEVDASLLAAHRGHERRHDDHGCSRGQSALSPTGT